MSVIGMYDGLARFEVNCHIYFFLDNLPRVLVTLYSIKWEFSRKMRVSRETPQFKGARFWSPYIRNIQCKRTKPHISMPNSAIFYKSVNHLALYKFQRKIFPKCIEYATRLFRYIVWGTL